MTRRAIIIGASISGMLTAKALSQKFDEVILLERDLIPDQPAFRSGTAQAQHAHILLRRGLIGIEKLFPGFTQKLIAAGGVMTNATQDWYLLFPTGAFPNFHSDFEFLCASRPLIEHTLRSALLKDCNNVSIRDQCNVLNVTLAENSPPSVTLSTSCNPGQQETLVTDFLVDASGRNSHAPEWLQQQGFGAVNKIQVKPYLGYATRRYSNVDMPPDVRGTLVMAKDPDITRGGVLFPIENNQYICTLYGFSKDYPPTEESGFLAYAKSLRSDIIYNGIQHATPESDFKAFIKKESTYHLYAKSSKWPMGFLIIGDAVCSFNPIYGQGITTSLLATEALIEITKRTDPLHQGFAKVAQRKVVRAYRAAWIISTNEDSRWPATEGIKAGRVLRAMHQFSNLIGKAATYNIKVTFAYIKVLHMTATPTTLLTPRMLARVLWAKFRQ